MQSFLSTSRGLISTFTVYLTLNATKRPFSLKKDPKMVKIGLLLTVICYFYPPQKGLK